MDLAKSATETGPERYSAKFIAATIANAIDDSKREFAKCYLPARIQR